MKRLFLIFTLLLLFPLCVNAQEKNIVDVDEIVNKTEYDVIIDNSSVLNLNKEKDEDKNGNLVSSEKLNKKIEAKNSGLDAYTIIVSLSIVAVVMSTSKRFIDIGR